MTGCVGFADCPCPSCRDRRRAAADRHPVHVPADRGGYCGACNQADRDAAAAAYVRANRVRTYRGVNIHPATGRARANGFRWEVIGAPGRPWSVLCDTLAGAREVIRDAVTAGT